VLNTHSEGFRRDVKLCADCGPARPIDCRSRPSSIATKAQSRSRSTARDRSGASRSTRQHPESVLHVLLLSRRLTSAWSLFRSLLVRLAMTFSRKVRCQGRILRIDATSALWFYGGSYRQHSALRPRPCAVKRDGACGGHSRAGSGHQAPYAPDCSEPTSAMILQPASDRPGKPE